MVLSTWDRVGPCVPNCSLLSPTGEQLTDPGRVTSFGADGESGWWPAWGLCDAPPVVLYSLIYTAIRLLMEVLIVPGEPTTTLRAEVPTGWSATLAAYR